MVVIKGGGGGGRVEVGGERRSGVVIVYFFVFGRCFVFYCFGGLFERGREGMRVY